MERQGVDEALKAADQMAWEKANALRAMADNYDCTGIVDRV